MLGCGRTFGSRTAKPEGQGWVQGLRGGVPQSLSEPPSRRAWCLPAPLTELTPTLRTQGGRAVTTPCHEHAPSPPQVVLLLAVSQKDCPVLPDRERQW